MKYDIKYELICLFSIERIKPNTTISKQKQGDLDDLWEITAFCTHNIEKIKSNNSLIFKENLEDNFFFVKVLYFFMYILKNCAKTQQISFIFQ